MSKRERKIKNEPCVHFMKFCASTAEERRRNEGSEREEMECVCVLVYTSLMNPKEHIQQTT